MLAKNLENKRSARDASKSDETDRSLVSCRAWCLGSMMFSLKSDARILAMAGLQISQPCAPGTPARFMIVWKSRRFLILTTWKRSTRDILTCTQRLLFVACPAFFSSALKMLVTRGTHPPHPKQTVSVSFRNVGSA